MYKLQNYNIKIRFIILGLLNILFTNIFLQIIILLFPLWISTFFSQMFNVILGFFLYSNLVFKIRKKNLGRFIKYFLFSIFTWNLNALIIFKINYHLNIDIRLSAILTIPLLAILSFYFQKKIIFKI
tara:strand:+ start:95 stop:475 length:381 start_codon:yes stop_codon:yes gene_type:complete